MLDAPVMWRESANLCGKSSELSHGATKRISTHNAYNHPSGVAEPSRADEALTQPLKHTLALVDVKVLDNFVVGGDAAMSFAERGLL